MPVQAVVCTFYVHWSSTQKGSGVDAGLFAALHLVATSQASYIIIWSRSWSLLQRSRLVTKNCPVHTFYHVHHRPHRQWCGCRAVCGPLPDHHDGTSQASCISSYDLTVRSNLLVGSLLSPFDLCNTPKKKWSHDLIYFRAYLLSLNCPGMHTFYHVHHRPHR